MAVTHLHTQTALEAMLDALSTRTGLDCTAASPDTLLEDLGFDSLARIETVLLIEEHGVEVPDALAAELRTIADLHALWEHSTHHNPSARAPHDDRSSIHLVPLGPQHLGWAYELHMEAGNLARYRTRASTPSPEAFHQLLWRGVVSQFAVQAGPQPIGIVSLLEPDWRNAHAHLAAVATSEWRGSGLILEGLSHLIDWTFDQFPLRKLYLETLATNYAAYKSGNGRRFQVEGILRDHEYIDGHWDDLIIAAIHRDTWSPPRP